MNVAINDRESRFSLAISKYICIFTLLSMQFVIRRLTLNKKRIDDNMERQGLF